MIPKEKAYDLMIKYFKISYCNDTRERHYNAKECALIALDEIIEATSIKYEFRDAELFYAGKKPMQYWLEVKKEIEAL